MYNPNGLVEACWVRRGGEVLIISFFREKKFNLHINDRFLELLNYQFSQHRNCSQAFQSSTLLLMEPEDPSINTCFLFIVSENRNHISECQETNRCTITTKKGGKWPYALERIPLWHIAP